MENIPVLSNRLDESNGIVENVLKMKAKKTPWHLRFAHKAKGLVSFVQNLLSPLTRKEGVRGGQLSAFFQSAAAAAAVGIGLLVGSNAAVQAACDPPVFDVCTHSFSGSWSSDGKFAVDIQFKGKSGKKYEVEWHGLKELFVFEDGWFGWVLTYDSVSDPGYSGGSEVTLTYEDFWWNQDSYGNYGCSIYEGDFEDGKWVSGDWVASVDFYAYQEAAYVSIDGTSSGLDFELSTYYCTIDWEPVPSPLKYGYVLGCWEWVGDRDMWPKYNGWYYHGDHGSPRFDYESSCSYEFWPSPSFGWRCP